VLRPKRISTLEENLSPTAKNIDREGHTCNYTNEHKNHPDPRRSAEKKTLQPSVGIRRTRGAYSNFKMSPMPHRSKRTTDIPSDDMSWSTRPPRPQSTLEAGRIGRIANEKARNTNCILAFLSPLCYLIFSTLTSHTQISVYVLEALEPHWGQSYSRR
jgi:hypothetical protein